jgi:tetratricopeptide (TPR) repeat protein
MFTVEVLLAENLADLFWEAHVAYKIRDYRRGAELYRTLIEKGYRDPDAIYNAAGCYALSGNHDKAFHYLKLLCANEFIDMEGFLTDSDFQPLKNDSRWVDAVTACQNAEKKYLAKSDKILYQLYLSAKNNPALASEATQKMMALISTKQLKTANDYFHAASVLSLVPDAPTMTLAEKLAQKADSMQPNHPQARSLIAVTKDRYLWLTKQPQIYGTQIQQDKDKKWTYEPFNPKEVSDQQRADANIPSLATLYK